MLLLVVLLAQMVPPSDDPPPVTAWGSIAKLHKTWEELNATCRKLAYDSPEGLAACSERDILGSQLGWLGWCVSYQGLEIKWEMCPRQRGGR
jgi:hypothetical protein